MEYLQGQVWITMDNLNCGHGIGLEWKCLREGADAKAWQQGYITDWAFWWFVGWYHHPL